MQFRMWGGEQGALFEFDLPGRKAEEIDVSVVRNELTIQVAEGTSDPHDES